MPKILDDNQLYAINQMSEGQYRRFWFDDVRAEVDLKGIQELIANATDKGKKFIVSVGPTRIHVIRTKGKKP